MLSVLLGITCNNEHSVQTGNTKISESDDSVETEISKSHVCEHRPRRRAHKQAFCVDRKHGPRRAGTLPVRETLASNDLGLRSAHRSLLVPRWDYKA